MVETRLEWGGVSLGPDQGLQFTWSEGCSERGIPKGESDAQGCHRFEARVPKWTGCHPLRSGTGWAPEWIGAIKGSSVLSEAISGVDTCFLVHVNAGSSVLEDAVPFHPLHMDPHGCPRRYQTPCTCLHVHITVVQINL